MTGPGGSDSATETPDSPRRVVDAWLQRAGSLDATERFAFLEHGLKAVWERARVPLGGITLVVGFYRVLVRGREQFPLLDLVTVGAAGIDLEGLRVESRGLGPEELESMFRFLITEFIGLLGLITGGLLTPILLKTLKEVAGHGSVEPGAASLARAPVEPRHGTP